ncbi:MAG TPA: hypothetical protein DHU33_05950 [Firmicutes bacterium]|nr:hypothetical protein [Bacillota bacterium]
MKLNNKGWSLNTLLICIAVFCIALLLSVFYVYRLGTQLKKSLSQTDQDNTKQNETIPNTYKTDLENISNATTEYLTTENKEVQENETLIININDLIEKGYISEIKDHENNTSCNAYSLVTNKNSAYNIKPFINCENYTTEGYGDF